MIRYRYFAPRKYKCLYCGHSPLEIWAFVWVDYRTSREKAVPVLVCEPGGCGVFFDPMEFDLSNKDLEVHK